jgi:hypothetical protein
MSPMPIADVEAGPAAPTWSKRFNLGSFDLTELLACQ